MRMQVWFLALLGGLRIWLAMHCDVGQRCSSDPVLLWLWHRPAVAAPIQPLAWEPPYVAGKTLKSQMQKKKRIFHSPFSLVFYVINVVILFIYSTLFLLPIYPSSIPQFFSYVHCFFLSNIFILWPHSKYMKIPRPGIESKPQMWPMPQLQQHWILF